MPEILLATLNAKYLHASFGLRYLLANLGPLRQRAGILEFDINQRPTDILESILETEPTIVGLGVYIWNVTPTTQLVAELKRVRPDLTVILGGPEVSHETDRQEIVALADYTITGEADLAFAHLCHQLLIQRRRPLQTVIPADLPEFAPRAGSSSSFIPPPSSLLALPYSLYTDEDIAHRLIYVEASRGCPFKCEFCLSSLDVPVRNVPLEPFLNELQHLLDRGVRHFKFVDRTFNLNLAISTAILQFFLARYRPGLFLHFEMIPDRLPEALRGLIAQFPPGALQFEVGIQTLNEAVAARISRRQNNARIEENFRYLRAHTGVHLHADLIAGLPGEDLPSFAAGFDRLVALNPQEIQVGILKRLRGTPIVRHDTEFQMVYSPRAPYEILQTSTLDFQTLQRLRRFSRYWDLLANSGNFLRTLPLLWRAGGKVGSGQGVVGSEETPAPPPQPATSHPQHLPLSTEHPAPSTEHPAPSTEHPAPSTEHPAPSTEHPAPSTPASPFWCFWAFSEWLFETGGRRTHAIALPRLAERLFTYLTRELGYSAAQVAPLLAEDYIRPARRDIPEFLRPHLPPDFSRHRSATRHDLPRRQVRHLQDETSPIPSES